MSERHGACRRFRVTERLGFANWAGNENCYQFIHDKIRESDPRNESGAVRWLGFGGDPRDGVPWTEPSWPKALEKMESRPSHPRPHRTGPAKPKSASTGKRTP
ncbi:MAG: hypothetical protein NTY19_42125 [Planctomycetota bacterium]|nr:hypothetical protein [Planctomycetota bacterium]